MKNVFLIPSPTRFNSTEETHPPSSVLPGPPADSDVVRPESPQELLAVVGSIIRAAGGTVLSGGDPLTHALQIGPWSGWIHADQTAPVLDAVVVVCERDQSSETALSQEALLALQSSRLQFGRVVVTGSQVVIAARCPFHALTNLMVRTFISGLLDDAAATAAAVGSEESPNRIGGYL
jgi:hypothetical protein